MLNDLDTHLPLGLFRCKSCGSSWESRVPHLLSWEDDRELHCCDRLGFLVEILEPAVES